MVQGESLMVQANTIVPYLPLIISVIFGMIFAGMDEWLSHQAFNLKIGGFKSPCPYQIGRRRSVKHGE